MAESQSISADDTTRSKTCLEQISAPPSEQDAASPFSTKIAEPYSLYEADQQTVVVLAAVIDSLTSYVLSEDAWELAISRAKDLCRSAGIPDRRAEDIIMLVVLQREKRKNTLSDMF